MMLGARTAAWSKSGYTAKDYVQDGLIIMLDDIENSGFPIHEVPAIYGHYNLIARARYTF